MRFPEDRYRWRAEKASIGAEKTTDFVRTMAECMASS